MIHKLKQFTAYQFYDFVMNGIAPIIKMVIKHWWYPWMCENICIALQKIMESYVIANIQELDKKNHEK